MGTVIMHPENKEQLSTFKAFAKALKVKFETSTYNSDFVAKIHQSKTEAEQGNAITLDPKILMGKYRVIFSTTAKKD